MYTAHSSFRTRGVLGVYRRVWPSSPELPRSVPCWTMYLSDHPCRLEVASIVSHKIQLFLQCSSGRERFCCTSSGWSGLSSRARSILVSFDVEPIG